MHPGAEGAWQARPMALDPDVAAQVAHLFDATLAQVLSGELPGPPAAGAMRRDDVAVTDGEVPGPGGPVRIRTYRSTELDAHEPAPALVWAHGGGGRYGGLDMPEADSVAQVAAASLPGEVVSVDYRLAPDHPFPAALDDVVAAYRWVRDGDHGRAVDRSRVALGGASAGAHVAAGATIAFRDAGQAPAALWLAYPVTDPVSGPYPEQRHPDCPPLLWLDGEAMAGMFATYVGEGADADLLPVTAVPGRADLAGFPPTLVATAEADALAPQGRAFAERARGAGVDVTVHDVGGVLHGYLNTVGDSRRADRALALHLHWLAGVLGGA